MGFTALASPLNYRVSRRDVLLFDTIDLLNLSGSMAELPKEAAVEIEWLASRGIVRDVRGEAPSETILRQNDVRKFYTDYHVYIVAKSAVLSIVDGSLAMNDAVSLEYVAKMIEPQMSRWYLDAAHIAKGAIEMIEAFLMDERVQSYEHLCAIANVMDQYIDDAVVRFMALQRAMRDGIDTVPLVTTEPAVTDVLIANKIPVAISVVLQSLPVPSDSTPWQKILEFKEDQDAVAALRRLRRWMRRIASEFSTEDELRDELHYLLDEYSAHLKLHRIKYDVGRIETFFTVAAEVVENVATFRLGSAVKAIFDIRRRGLELYEAELNMPGREVAYLVEVRKRFQATA